MLISKTNVDKWQNNFVYQNQIGKHFPVRILFFVLFFNFNLINWLLTLKVKFRKWKIQHFTAQIHNSLIIETQQKGAKSESCNQKDLDFKKFHLKDNINYC